MTSFSAAWGRYYEYLRVERRRPATTISRYRETLWRWHGFLGGKRWQKAGPADLGRFLDRRPLAANTMLGYAVAVRVFYRWAAQQGLTGTDRMRTFALPKGGRPVARAVPLADVRTALAAAAGDERMVVMLGLAYFAGLRTVEISRARIEDVRLHDPQPVIHVPRGKGDRARTVPLSAAAVELLAGYLARRPGAGPLVESERHPGRPITAHSVSAYIAAHLRSVGIDAGAHGLRHAYATELIRAKGGRNAWSVARALGHADTRLVETTYAAAYSGEWAELAADLPDPRGNGPPRPRVEPVGLAALVPVDVADQLAAAVAVLERHGPEVARAAETLGRATTQAWLATLGLDDPAQLAGMRAGDFPDHTDEEWAACEAALGIDRGWTLADQLRDAIDDL